MDTSRVFFSTKNMALCVRTCFGFPFCFASHASQKRRGVLETSVGDKCCREVLEMSVVGHCWMEELEKSVAGKFRRRVL